jgi:hypothetical protein
MPTRIFSRTLGRLKTIEGQLRDRSESNHTYEPTFAPAWLTFSRDARSISYSNEELVRLVSMIALAPVTKLTLYSLKTYQVDIDKIDASRFILCHDRPERLRRGHHHCGFTAAQLNAKASFRAMTLGSVNRSSVAAGKNGP